MLCLYTHTYVNTIPTLQYTFFESWMSNQTSFKPWKFNPRFSKKKFRIQTKNKIFQRTLKHVFLISQFLFWVLCICENAYNFRNSLYFWIINWCRYFLQVVVSTRYVKRLLPDLYPYGESDCREGRNIMA